MQKPELPPSNCIGCSKVLNAARCPDGSLPSPGDITICIHCGTLMEFGEDLSLCQIKPDKVEGIKKSAIWSELMSLWRGIRKVF